MKTQQWITLACLTIFSAAILIMPSAYSIAGDGATYHGDPVFIMSCANNKLQASFGKVSLNEDTMRIAYDFINTCNNNTALIEIKIPAYTWEGAGNNYADRSYSELVLLVNGKQVSYQKIQEAYYQGRNITDELAKYKISPNDISDIDRWTVNMTDENLIYYQPLIQKGVMSLSNPEWETRNTYTYEFTPTNIETISIEYIYTALPGYDYFSKEINEFSPLAKMKMTWDDMVTAYGTNKAVYFFKWIYIPICAAEDIPIDTFDISISENKIYNFMIALRQGELVSIHKGKIGTSLKNFKQPCLRLLMFTSAD